MPDWITASGTAVEGMIAQATGRGARADSFLIKARRSSGRIWLVTLRTEPLLSLASITWTVQVVVVSSEICTSSSVNSSSGSDEERRETCQWRMGSGRWWREGVVGRRRPQGEKKKRSVVPYLSEAAGNSGCIVL